MKHILPAAATVAVITLLACSKDKPNKPDSGIPVVSGYFQPLSAEALIIDIGANIPTEDNLGYSLIFTNRINRVAPDTYKTWSYKPDGIKPPTPGFMEIAREYNDVNYAERQSDPVLQNYCFRNKFTRIDILAADDFPEGYPTGTSLNALFTVSFQDMGAFIASDYNLPSSTVRIEDESLDTFNARTGGTLMPFDFQIRLAPVNNLVKPLDHHYTVRYTFTDRQVLELSTKIGQ